MNYELCKYPPTREWSIYDKTSRCYVLFGTKRELQKRLKELNK